MTTENHQSFATARRVLRSTADRLRRGPQEPRAAPGDLEPLRGWTREPSVPATGRSGPPPTIAVLVYQGVSSSETEIVADALAVALAARVRLVSAEAGTLAGVEPARAIMAEAFDQIPEPYGVVIPGGLGWRREATRPEVLRWLEDTTEVARGTITVSTGSLLLAAAGTLQGQEAAGHWLAGDLLVELGAYPSTDRAVHGRLLATASGALAGAEAARRLAKEMRFSV